MKLTVDNQRMWDLVRFMRMELHEKGLVTDEEYATLAEDHAAVKRLEDYDGLRASRDEELKEAVAAAEEAAFRRTSELAEEFYRLGALEFREKYGSAVWSEAVLALIPEGNHLARYVADKVAAAVLAESEWWSRVGVSGGYTTDEEFSRLAANRVPGADPLARIREEAKREMREAAAHRVRLMIEHGKNCALSTDKDCDCSASDVWRAVRALPVTAPAPSPTSCAHAVVTSVDGVYVCAECGGAPNFIPSPGRASEETPSE